MKIITTLATLTLIALCHAQLTKKNPEAKDAGSASVTNKIVKTNSVVRTNK